MVAELACFDLECDLRLKWRHLWRDDSFYIGFLKEQGDIDIVLGRWERDDSGRALSRSVECSHPVKASFPGMPSHTRCIRRQTAVVSPDATNTLTLTEEMRFEGESLPISLHLQRVGGSGTLCTSMLEFTNHAVFMSLDLMRASK